jgi:hypothetical protein
MFSRNFTRDHKREKVNHNAISFMSNLPKEEIIQKLVAMGVESFINPDSVRTTANMYDMNFKPYNDNRIVGNVTFHSNSQCCSFTRNSQRWFIFPIHNNYLDNTGFDADDMLKWIKFLNDMNAGFEYRYLGYQEATLGGGISNSFRENNSSEGRSFHWVLVPASGANVHFKKTYLHWIFLRYMINTTHSLQNMHAYTNASIMGEKMRLPYYCIPRIAMMFHEDYNVSRFKSLLYAHLANPFYYYYGFIPSDLITDNASIHKADVSIKAKEFKQLLCEDASTGANSMLSVERVSSENFKKMIGRWPEAPYNHIELFKLFDAGDYKGFIKHIKDSYKALKAKGTAKAKKDVKANK